ncbi:Replication factor C (RF-C) subunit [Sorochytrium milnesiophthora]
MALWVDKHRPHSLDKLDYHRELSARLTQLAQSDDFPHMLVYGPSGAGKKTRIVATLRELFGPGAEKLKIDQRTFQTASGKKIEMNVISSNYHIEINPSDVGNQDRIVVQELIKEIAQTQQIDAAASRRFKVVVISEADSLSPSAQHALRRTMEKYMRNLRIILCCNSTSKIISPVRSRCLLLRIAAPEVAEITEILLAVSRKEGLSMPEALAVRVAEKSDRNLRRAVLMLEALKVSAHTSALTDNTDLEAVCTADWEAYIAKIATMIIEEQSVARIQAVRPMLYELLTHCIPDTTIFRTLAFELVKRVDPTLQGRIIQIAAQYEHQSRLGSKAIFHLEAFVIKVMATYKRYIADLLS